MAFDYTKLLCRSLVSGNSEPRIFDYMSDDAIAAIKAAGYFTAANLRVGDMITVIGKGVPGQLQVTAISPQVTVVQTTQA